VRVITAKVSTGDEIGLAVASLIEQRVGAMLPAADILFVVHAEMLVALANAMRSRRSTLLRHGCVPVASSVTVVLLLKDIGLLAPMSAVF
jgi:hypothetical protein